MHGARMRAMCSCLCCMLSLGCVHVARSASALFMCREGCARQTKWLSSTSSSIEFAIACVGSSDMSNVSVLMSHAEPRSSSCAERDVPMKDVTDKVAELNVQLQNLCSVGPQATCIAAAALASFGIWSQIGSRRSVVRDGVTNW